MTLTRAYCLILFPVVSLSLIQQDYIVINSEVFVGLYGIFLHASYVALYWVMHKGAEHLKDWYFKNTVAHVGVLFLINNVPDEILKTYYQDYWNGIPRSATKLAITGLTALSWLICAVRYLFKIDKPQ